MVLLATNCIPVVVNHLLMAFYAVRTPHNCRVPDDFIGNKSSLLPPGESKFGFAQCEMYVDADNHSLGTTACIHGYEFHFEDDKEWNIVAEVQYVECVTACSTFIAKPRVREKRCA